MRPSFGCHQKASPRADQSCPSTSLMALIEVEVRLRLALPQPLVYVVHSFIPLHPDRLTR